VSKGLYPGTFDPITNGHIDIVRKAALVFDEVIVGVAVATGKNSVFSPEEREAIARECVKDIANVRVMRFDGLVVRFAESIGCTSLIRGLRAVSDFEYELQLALMNKNLDERIDTMFFVPEIKYLYLSSSMVREVIALGGSLRDYVPPYAEEMLRAKYQKRTE
jgi:pantetheine-phosphate adenylyltransferase